ncbi:MAG: RraA family protein [Saprospiraceae bacterium]|nr:RraA family protein [Saprospiraceae bacterium]
MDKEKVLQALRTELFTAVVGDVMDDMGLQEQFLPPHIRPLHPSMKVAGTAMTVLESDLQRETAEANAKSFGLMFEALDDLQQDEIYLCSGASPTYALWGELMSTRALHLHAAGAILDGYVRDTEGILELNFPTFCYGSYAQDQAPRGRVVDYRCPLRIGQAAVRNGDWVLGDIDGVVIIPHESVSEVIERALEKVHGENLVRAAIKNGMSSAEAFKTFGIM